MNSQQLTSSPQLRYLPSAQAQTTFASATDQPEEDYQSPKHLVKYGIKRPRFDEGTLAYEEESHERTPAHVQHPIAFQIRHRSTDKTRGLRHFAHKVCEKVKEKGQTNYNEVADELVAEYFDQLPDIPQDPDKYQYDVRNIRRRVYDALNVLMAMNIIEKEKKEIHWVGLPTSSLAECRRLEEEKTQRQERIRQKTEQLQELIVQLVAYKSLVQRNRERERSEGRPPNSAILYLPYIIVSTDKKTMVECAIAPDKSEYWFNFDRPFEIHDDIEVLKRLGLAYGVDRGEVLAENVSHIKSCLPPALRDYIDQILAGTLINRKSVKTGAAQFGQALVKLDPNSRDVRATPNDSIVVRATRANLSGVAPSGDGGPMGSFLGPVTQVVKMQPHIPAQQPPVARYTVIPRPVSARYSSSGLRSTLPDSQQQYVAQAYEQPQRSHQRLGGVLHYEVPVHPSRDPLLQYNRHRVEPYFEEEHMMEHQTEQLYPGEEYIEGDGVEQIVEEEVVADEQV